MGDSNKIACITWRIDLTKQFGTLVATGYQPRPMSQKKEQPEPSSSPSTRHVIITLPAWHAGTALGNREHSNAAPAAGRVICQPLSQDVKHTSVGTWHSASLRQGLQEACTALSRAY